MWPINVILINGLDLINFGFILFYLVTRDDAMIERLIVADGIWSSKLILFLFPSQLFMPIVPWYKSFWKLGSGANDNT